MTAAIMITSSGFAPINLANLDYNKLHFEALSVTAV